MYMQQCILSLSPSLSLVYVYITLKTRPHLLAARLSDLLHFVVFVLDLLGVGLTQALHLHLETQLSLKFTMLFLNDDVIY